MSIHTRLLPCGLALLLSACGQPQEPATHTPTDNRLPDDNVFSDQVRALEKAQGVEKTLQDAEAQRRAVLEEQGR